jgi:hypothetical protein
LAFHVLDTEVNGFTDTGEGFGNGLALRIAVGNRGTNHDITAVVFVRFEKNFEIAHSPYNLPSSVSRKSFICHSLRKTPGVWAYSSHFGTCQWSDVLDATTREKRKPPAGIQRYGE